MWRVTATLDDFQKMVWLIAGLAALIFVGAVNWQLLVSSNMGGSGSEIIVEIPDVDPVNNPGDLPDSFVDVFLNVTFVDWGNLVPGQNVSSGLLILNAGECPVTLEIRAEDWSSAAAEAYLVFGWSYNGEVLMPGEELAVSLFLSVDPEIKDVVTFSFNVIVTATQKI